MNTNKQIIEILRKNLKEKYGIEADNIEENAVSTDGNVYIINSQVEKYVVKIYDNINHVKSMVLLHSYLYSKGLHVPQIIVTNCENEYIKLDSNLYAVVYSFLDGNHLTWNKQTTETNDDIIRKVAQTISCFHSLTSGANNFNLPKLSFGIQNSTERLSALHFDLTKHNIFITTEKAGLIDFDDAKYGPSVCDVAIIVSILFFSKTNGVELEGAKKFIDAYYCNELELKKKELPLMKFFALKWIDYILDNNEFDTSTTESFVVRSQLIDKYFDLID